MKDNAAHDKDPGYLMFNFQMTYDKYRSAKILSGKKTIGYFAARVRFFLKLLDELQIQIPSDMKDLVAAAHRDMARESGGKMEDFRSNPGDSTQLPPYEPFKPHQGGVFGEKQTRMYRLLTMKHALKIEKLGMRISRGVNATAMVKKEFGLKGNRDKIIQQFEALLPDILAGFKPMPGWKEEPYAWTKNRPPHPDAGGAHRHPFDSMQNNPPEKRLYLREVEQNDPDSDVRLLEMLVDAGNNQGVTMQFFADCNLYGIREAYLYLGGYARDGMWRGDLNAVKNQVNAMLKKHGRSRYLTNPSEPTYEPDPFRNDDEHKKPDADTEYTMAFKRLFGLARSWAIANEAGNQTIEDKILSDIRYFIDYIEHTGLHAPEGMERKYHKIRNFFLINGYGDNPGHGGKRPGSGRPRKTPDPAFNTMFEGKQYKVTSTKKRPVLFRTQAAAILYAREQAQQSTSDTLRVYNKVYGLIAQFTSGKPEKIFHRIPERHRSSHAQPGSGLIRKKMSDYTGYQPNPWLVAGPQVNLMPDTAAPGQAPTQLTPANLKGEPVAPEAGSVAGIGMAPEAPEEEISASPRRGLSEKQHRVRSRISKRQRRNSSGRFYDNPGFPHDTNFIQVYSRSLRGKMLTGYFKFDGIRQIATIRALEVKGDKVQTIELDFQADETDATRLFKMLKRKGFAYITKRLQRQACAMRASEENIEKETQPTSGYAPAGQPTAGAIPLGYKGTGEAVQHAQTLYEQVAHEVAEGDFEQAVNMLLKIRELVHSGTTENLWALEMASDKAKRLVDDRWPGAIKRLQNN